MKYGLISVHIRDTLNTEVGVLFDDVAFSRLVTARFDEVIDPVAFRLRLAQTADGEGFDGVF